MKNTLKIILIGIPIALILFLFSNIKVNATAYQTWTTSQVRIKTDVQGTGTWSSWQNTNYTFNNLTYPVTNMQFRVKSSDGLSMDNSYVLNFGYKPSPDAITRLRVNARKDGQTDVYEELTCTWERGDVTYLATCNMTPKLNYTSDEYMIINIDFQTGYLTSIRGIQNQYLEREGVNSVITQTGDQITNIIEETTTQIIDIMEQEHTYNTEDYSDDIEDYHDLEEDIKQNIDLDTTGKLSFWWNTQTLTYIWTEVERFKNSIGVYWTWIIPSFMALGIMKLILGR